MTLKPKILELRAKGYTYKEIKEELKCSKSTICYYLGENQEYKKYLRKCRYMSNRHPYITKIESFSRTLYTTGKSHKNPTNSQELLYHKVRTFSRIIVQENGKMKAKHTKPTFTAKDVINKVGENPICYLTGEPIDIHKPRTYHFDHIIPRSQGGSNNLDNLGICTKQANLCKDRLNLDEYLEMCKKTLEHNGYKVEKLT